MHHPRASDSDTTAFLVEHYLPPAAADSLAASVARVALLCADMSHSGLGVQYLHSAHLPTEDTCFCLFRAPDSDAIRAINREADFRLDRITDAVLLHADESPAPTPRSNPSNSTQPAHPRHLSIGETAMTRPHPRRLAAAAVFVAGSLLLAACSNSSPAKPTASAKADSAPADTTAATSQQPAPDASGGATASDGGGTSAPAGSGHLHACLLVSEQDATTALGADPGTGHEDTQEGAFGGDSKCNYTIASGGVQVSASSIAGKALCDGNRQPNSVDVAGVGDRAFETPATSAQEATVYYLKGDTCVSITIETPASMGSAKDRVIALATTAAGRV